MMMIGMGTPISQRSIERMVSPQELMCGAGTWLGALGSICASQRQWQHAQQEVYFQGVT
jgi:hypothetical protein